ncbi:MAG: hypothetical protein U9N59_01285 [Campylobacterota bacterium]|nr:hypothetical protein [Campylobacterota bacterium]
MLLSPEVLAMLILNIIFLLFGTIAFILSIKIYLNWDINSTKKLQYKLEKQSFLTATIIKYIFIIKLPLFLFFIFTLDKVSNVLTGAMCAAGVVDATQFGTYLFILKILNIYLFGFWLILHYLDIKHESLPYTKLKFGFFIVAFFVFAAEIVLEGVMFNAIDVDKMVSCCGTLYSSSATSYISTIFLIDTDILLSLFYGNFLFIVLFYFLKQKQLFALTNFIFIIISIISLISFFGTYIYELPTHHCPFCFLQKDYYYVGYLIYTLLFVGTFNGLTTGFINDNNSRGSRSYNISLIFNFLYVLLVSAYPVIYYFTNGVWL